VKIVTNNSNFSAEKVINKLGENMSFFEQVSFSSFTAYSERGKNVVL
jgi:hypothetical protein